MQNEPIHSKARDKFAMLSESPEFREAYEQRFKAQVDFNSQMNGARREGEEKGRIEGIQEGRREGKREEKINIALKLLNEGLN